MKNQESPKPPGDMMIVVLNLAILAVYTIISKLSYGAFLLDGFFILVHAIICFMFWDEKRRRVWQLSGLLVLLIGFSTCAAFLFS